MNIIAGVAGRNNGENKPNKSFKPCVQKACTHSDQANSVLGRLTRR